MTTHSEEMRHNEHNDQFLERHVDNLNDVFFVLDTDGDIVQANEKAAEVTGVSQDELRSINALEVIAPADHNVVAAHFQSTLETGQTKVEAHLLNAASREVPVQVCGHQTEFLLAENRLNW